MMLGKRVRRRPSMKRTTSMTEFTLGFNGVVVDIHNNNNNRTSSQDQEAPRFNIHHIHGYLPDHHHQHQTTMDPNLNSGGVDYHQWYSNDNTNKNYDYDTMSLTAGRLLPVQRRNSADFVHETAQFLRLCSLCNRRLVPGHDIYMYRGDNAFCSLECRQHQMAQDERKDKKRSNSLASSTKKFEATATVTTVVAVPQLSTTTITGGTVTSV